MADIDSSMTPNESLESVREENETALSRLGSSKSLYAATGGELDVDNVLQAAADAEHAAAETFDTWTQDESNGTARNTFETNASEERDHTQTVLAELEAYTPDDSPPAMHAHLRGLESTPERAGGLLGRTLAAEKSKEQLVGFFVGQADPQTADLFRELKADVDDQQQRALTLLDAVCETDADWNSAVGAATDTIQTAYTTHVDQLEAQGVNPKPVC